MEKTSVENTPDARIDIYKLPRAEIVDDRALHDAHRIRQLVCQWDTIQRQQSALFQDIVDAVVDDLVDDPEQL